MRSVILKGTGIARINYLILSGRTSHKTLKLFCDYGGESSRIAGGKGSLDCGCCPHYMACRCGEDHEQIDRSRLARRLQERACTRPRPGSLRRRCDARLRLRCRRRGDAGKAGLGWPRIHRWLIFLLVWVLIKPPKRELGQDLE